MGVVTIPRPFFPCPCPCAAARTAPSTARLSASVPPEVNNNSSSWTPRAPAIRSRASSITARMRRPAAWVLEGLPACRSSTSSMAWRARGRRGLVAL